MQIKDIVIMMMIITPFFVYFVRKFRGKEILISQAESDYYLSICDYKKKESAELKKKVQALGHELYKLRGIYNEDKRSALILKDF